MNDVPWVALPFGAHKRKYKAKIPCDGYPTPGVISGRTGNVIRENVFNRVNEDSL